MRITKSFFIDIIAYFGIFISTLFFVFKLNYKNCNFAVLLTFVLIGIISFYNICNCSLNISLRRIFYIYTYIFFFMAPLQQYTSGVIFWRENGLSLVYSDFRYLIANIIILISMIMIEVGYRDQHRFVINRRNSKNEIKISQNKNSYIQNYVKGMSETNKLTTKCMIMLLGLCVISFIILALTNNVTSSGYIIGGTAVNIQLRNILKYIPVCSLLVCIIQCGGLKLKNNNAFIWLFIILECIIIFFPLWGNMARYFLFGTYIVFITCFFRTSKFNSFFFLLLFIGFCSSFSNTKYMTSVMSIIQSFSPNFNHVDFDSYQILMACMAYVEESGILWGKNIISALLFLLPRSIWKGKLEATGTIVVRNYGSWQENVSTPLVAELYAAFGWFGIIIGGWLFGKLLYQIDMWGDSDNQLKRGICCLLTGMSLYIYRGSLLAALAFTFGICLAFLLIDFLCRKFKW